MEPLDKVLMQKQIAAAVLSQDQLVFTYARPETDEIIVRFATPLELGPDYVLCAQHLPEDGYRKFKLDNIKMFHRVVTRATFFSADKETAKKSEAKPG